MSRLSGVAFSVQAYRLKFYVHFSSLPCLPQIPPFFLHVITPITFREEHESVKFHANMHTCFQHHLARLLQMSWRGSKVPGSYSRGYNLDQHKGYSEIFLVLLSLCTQMPR
jgi:hypothetical protein